MDEEINGWVDERMNKRTSRSNSDTFAVFKCIYVVQCDVRVVMLFGFYSAWPTIIKLLTFGLPRGGGTHPLRFFRCHTFCIWNRILTFYVALWEFICAH